VAPSGRSFRSLQPSLGDRSHIFEELPGAWMAHHMLHCTSDQPREKCRSRFVRLVSAISGLLRTG